MQTGFLISLCFQIYVFMYSKIDIVLETELGIHVINYVK